MIAVYAEGDKVIMDLCGRLRDAILTPLEAERLADAMEERAADAERAMPELVRGEVWSLFVTSFDRHVVLRFTPPPEAGPGVHRATMPPRAAREAARMVRANAVMAGVGMRIETTARK